MVPDTGKNKGTNKNSNKKGLHLKDKNKFDLLSCFREDGTVDSENEQ